MCAFLSWILLIVGVLFVILSLAGAFLEIWKDFVEAAAEGIALGDKLGEIGNITKLVDAVTKLLAVLLTSPKWLLLLFAGFAVAGLSHWVGTSVCA